ncbi:hypothetical protein LINGRAHAP2_LOCUS10124 [Linum grandiflorum]
MRPLAAARQFDEGSSSQGGCQLPWHGRAINSVPPFEPSREVIRSYQHRLYFVHINWPKVVAENENIF